MTDPTVSYALSRTLPISYEEADQRVRDALQEEGFGVLTEIDVAATLREKLDVQWPRYEILGACNPPLAHKALQAEPDIGLLLPCNVVVYEGDEPGTSVVAALDPEVQLGVTGREDMVHLAQEVRQAMERVLDSL